MITAGIDCGAKNTKTIIMKNGKIIGKGMVRTGFDPGKAVEESLDQALIDTGNARDDIHKIYATGSGQKAVKIADDSVDDGFRRGLDGSRRRPIRGRGAVAQQQVLQGAGAGARGLQAPF